MIRQCGTWGKLVAPLSAPVTSLVVVSMFYTSGAWSVNLISTINKKHDADDLSLELLKFPGRSQFLPRNHPVFVCFTWHQRDPLFIQDVRLVGISLWYIYPP